MSQKIRQIVEQILIASNIFIVFLLLFENKWVVPVWLQSVGRMHPLLLHFPIVILLMAMAMEFFRFKTTYAANDFYRIFLNNLLLVGILSAALTVIMGLFLSQEPGYAGDVLQWHKWSGVGIVFLVSLIYWCRNSHWYKAPIAKTATVLASICVVLAGHFGATLTHGADFIAEPLTKSAPVSLENALVFANVIQPIFEQKCVRCHNSDKTKGELMLTTEQSILKGGKTGLFLVAGKPEISLFLQRIHLPTDDKKHMPPLGQAQLNPQEIALLSLWVKGNADFKKKVTDLPTNDSLRLLATTLFLPMLTEAYDFEAADDETIKKLNNEYRTIAPLARESPGLSVNFYNKNTYNAQNLAELSAIKTQVVSLNLAKMPITDAELKSLAIFENLQKLNLNFTNITGNGLKELINLKQLKSLSLSGNKLIFKDLQIQIKAFEQLKTVAIWNTTLRDSEIEQLQKESKNIQFIAGFKDDGRNPIQLNPPQLKNSSPIFGQSLA
ncbi:MAG: cytochrome C, partial [Runella slithyformis]